MAHRNIPQFIGSPGFPRFNPMMILHGEEHLEIYKPIQLGVKYNVITTISDV